MGSENFLAFATQAEDTESERLSSGAPVSGGEHDSFLCTTRERRSHTALRLLAGPISRLIGRLSALWELQGAVAESPGGAPHGSGHTGCQGVQDTDTQHRPAAEKGGGMSGRGRPGTGTHTKKGISWTRVSFRGLAANAGTAWTTLFMTLRR